MRLRKARLLQELEVASGGARAVDLITEEESAEGAVSLDVCVRCLSVRGGLALLSFLLMAATTTTQILQGWWLADWTNMPEETQTDYEVRRRMRVRARARARVCVLVCVCVRARCCWLCVCLCVVCVRFFVWRARVARARVCARC